MATEHPRPPALGPYRANEYRAAELRRRRRPRLRWSLARVLAAPLYIGVAITAVAALVVGLLNATARERGLYLAPGVARIETATAWCLIATVPVVACAVLWNRRRFSAPRAWKRRYLTRHIGAHAMAVAIAVASIAALRPADEELLASAMGNDGREAFVTRWGWGCGYRVSIAEGRWLTRQVTAIGPFACDARPPRVEWRGNALTLTTAEGETMGAWDADR